MIEKRISPSTVVFAIVVLALAWVLTWPLTFVAKVKTALAAEIVLSMFFYSLLIDRIQELEGKLREVKDGAGS